MGRNAAALNISFAVLSANDALPANDNPPSRIALRRTGFFDIISSDTLGYTGAHELASEAFSNLAYTYAPPTGTDTYAAVNVLNQYPTVTPAGQGAQTISYDGNGNLTSASGWTYAYDAENKMMSASNGGAVSAAYAYDPLGRRTEKSGTGVATTFFLNDGADEIAEYDGSGDVLRRFVPGPAINEPVVFEDCTGATQPNCTGSGVVNNFFHTDHHGSVVEMSIWGATPANTQPYAYDACGNNPSMSLTGEPFRYVGMYLDAETGLYQDRSRMYSPALGRFMQTDAVGYDVDVNDYTYVGNDPTDMTDLTGKAIDPSTISEQCQGAGSSCTIVQYSQMGSTQDQDSSSRAQPRATSTNGGNTQVAQVGPAAVAIGTACAIAEPCGATVGTVIVVGGIIIMASPSGDTSIHKNEQGDDAADRPPAGSKPIDKTPWSGDHEEIKEGIGAGPTDNVRISPKGDVWGQNPDGSWTNHGPAKDYTGSGKPKGQRGKDRDSNR